MIKNNPYLGLSIGLPVLVVSIYSLYLRFKGVYTNAFAIISGFLVLVFLLFNFFKHKT